MEIIDVANEQNWKLEFVLKHNSLFRPPIKSYG